jgi:hypothetical protein
MSRPRDAHIGVAVADLEVVRALLAPLGAEDRGTRAIDALGLTATFVEVGGQRLELMQAHDPAERSRALAGAAARLHHVAICIDDLESRMSLLRDLGVRFQGPIGAREIEQPIAASGALHAWTVPATSAGLMLQLTQPSSEEMN